MGVSRMIPVENAGQLTLQTGSHGVDAERGTSDSTRESWSYRWMHEAVQLFCGESKLIALGRYELVTSNHRDRLKKKWKCRETRE